MTRRLFILLTCFIAPFQVLNAQPSPEKTVCTDINAIMTAFKSEKSGTYVDYSKPLGVKDLKVNYICRDLKKQLVIRVIVFLK